MEKLVTTRVYRNIITTRTSFIFLLFLFLFANFPVIANADNPSPPLRIVYNKNNPPLKFEGLDGNAAGLLPDIWHLWGQKTGRQLEFIAAPWEKTLQMVRDGEADIHAGLFFSEERDHFMDFSMPLFNLEYLVFVHDTIQSISKLEDLISFRIGVPKGYTQQFMAERLPDSALAVYDDFPSLYEAALHNEIKIFISPQFNYSDFLNRHGKNENSRFSPVFPAYSRDYRGGVAKKRSKLLSEINQGLARITAEERAAIEHEWLVPTEESLDTQTLLISIPTNQHPLTFLDGDGRPSGFLVDLWRLWSKKTGHKIAFLPGTMEESLKAVSNDKADIHSGLLKNEERSRWLLFSEEPLYGIGSRFYFLKNTLPIQNFSALKDQRIACIKGSWQQNALLQHLPSSQILGFNNAREMLIALRQGEVELIFAAELNMGELLDRQRLRSRIHRSREQISREHIFAAVKQTNKALLSLINKGLENITQTELLELERQWIRDFSAHFFTHEEQPIPLKLTESEKAWLTKHPQMRLGIDHSWPPYEFIDKNGKYQGMSADIMKRFSQQLGYSLAPVQNLRWKEVLDGIRQQKLDLIPMLVPSAERAKFMLFTKPYLKFPFVIFSRNDAPLITGLEDLQNKQVALEKGYVSIEYIRRDYPNIKILEFETTLEALRAVSLGNADAYVGNLVVGSYQIGKEGLVNLKVAAPTSYSNSLSIGVRKDWPELVSMLNKAIDQFSDSNRASIRNKWLTIRYEQGIDYRLVWKILIGSGIVLFLAFLWIMQIQRSKKALAAARDEAQQANRFKSEFLANMSHEIRTPMNAIMGLTHLALQTGLTPKQHDYLHKAHKASQDLLRVINDILDFSKLEAGKLNVESISFKLDDVLENLAALISIKAEKKGLEVLFDAAHNVPQALLGDPLRLGQILINLTDNAIKFTEQGEVVLKVEVEEETVEQVTLLFSVVDTGIGLSSQQQEKLFKAFSQADGSTTRKYGGTGLGLTICRQLVQLMGGELSVESSIGKGSIFSFSIPFAKAHVPAFHRSSTDLRGTRVLVVDDNETARDVLRDALESFDFQVTTVASGEEALEELKRPFSSAPLPYQLVLMDWKMKGMDGIETSKRIKKLASPGIPTIIMVTAYGREEVMQQADQIGLDGFLIKPVNRSLLFDAIMDALAGGGREKTQNRMPVTIPVRETMPQWQGKKVLIAEDNDINRQVLRELLEQTGLQVVEAVNGKKGVRCTKEQDFDAIFMDIQMPEMDGFEASRLIRAENPHVPIIAITAHAMAEEKEKCLASGMNDHVTKPIDPEKLFAALQKWLKSSGKNKHNIKQEDPPQTQSEDDISFPELDGIDINSALNLIAGNKILLNKLLKKFITNHGKTDQEIKEAFERNDFELVHRVSHTMAGVAGTIGAKSLESAARKLLQSIKQKQYAKSPPLLDAFEHEHQRVVRSLSSLTEEDKQPPPFVQESGECDAGPLKELLHNLRPALKKRNPIDCRDIMGRIADLQVPLACSEELLELKRVLDKYQFKDAEALLTSVNRKLGTL